MPEFAAVHDAMDFLVGKIVTEAQREGIPFSEVERKMLYFSETAWTLPDIAKVNEEFDRDYEQAPYEKKVSSLIRRLRAADRKANQHESEAWMRAVRRVRDGDHYILVMIDQAEAPESSQAHILRLGLITLIGCCIALVILYIYNTMNSR